MRRGAYGQRRTEQKLHSRPGFFLCVISTILSGEFMDHKPLDKYGLQIEG